MFDAWFILVTLLDFEYIKTCTSVSDLEKVLEALKATTISKLYFGLHKTDFKQS